MKEKIILRNYDNRELTDDEELVTYFKNEADADNLLNPDSIVRRRYGRAYVTGVRTAFKKGFETDTARKQFNSYINDLAGHFHPAGVGSLEQMQEDYDLEKGSNNGDPSVQHELYENATLMVKRLTAEAPQLMAAVIFHRQGLCGSAFADAMKIEHHRSATFQKKLFHILSVMIHEGYDAIDLNVRKTKNDAYYKKIIIEHMNEILDDLIEMSRAFA